MNRTRVPRGPNKPVRTGAMALGIVLALIFLFAVVFVLPPLIILLAWNGLGNELLGWPRIDWIQAVLITLVVYVVGGAFRAVTK